MRGEDPDRRGRGIGDRLVEFAKERQPTGLQLWTFQVNLAAQRFYERNGFVAVERTDGAGNEEREPDVRYVWRAVPILGAGPGPAVCRRGAIGSAPDL